LREVDSQWSVLHPPTDMNPRLIPLILVFLGLSYGIWHYHSDAGRLRLEMDQLKASHVLALQAKDEELQHTLSAQNAQHQKALQTLSDEHDKKLGELRTEQRQQIARAYKEFENIFTGNKQTLDYIAALEAKMKAGQTLSKIELEKMVIIASGVSFLQKQYQKPLQEFTALQDYFEDVAKRPNEKPAPRFGFFKRIFSKNFREAEKEQLREEGARRAFEEAQGKFDGVYASAQNSMKAVNLDTNSLLKKLDDVIQAKQEANATDLSAEFAKARAALRTHQEILDFDPEVPTQAPKVQP
jgi:hypothetical protein